MMSVEVGSKFEISVKLSLHVFCECSKHRNSNSECSAMNFHGSKMTFHEISKIQDFSEIMRLLDAHVLENARGSSLARISLPCGVASSF